jgi:hypothetical protein
VGSSCLVAVAMAPWLRRGGLRWRARAESGGAAWRAMQRGSDPFMTTCIPARDRWSDGDASRIVRRPRQECTTGRARNRPVDNIVLGWRRGPGLHVACTRTSRASGCSQPRKERSGRRKGGPDAEAVGHALRARALGAGAPECQGTDPAKI